MRTIYNVRTGVTHIKSKTRQFINRFTIFAASGVAALGLAVIPMTSAATTTQVVTEVDVTRQAENTPPTDRWVVYTRAGTPPTAAAFREGPNPAPLGTGSLELTTSNGAEKVFAFNYDHVGTELSYVDDISYNTYRSTGSAQQVAALNVVIDFNGPAVAGGFSTLVFEPVYNTDQGAVVSGEWQDWIASGSGVWWSTRPINGQCAGATSICDKTWSEIVANNPDATVMEGVGINQGSGNPGLKTAVDAFTFNNVKYDFEFSEKVTSKDQCKENGWMNVFARDGRAFKNQGACVSYVSSNGKSQQ